MSPNGLLSHLTATDRIRPIRRLGGDVGGRHRSAVMHFRHKETRTGAFHHRERAVSKRGGKEMTRTKLVALSLASILAVSLVAPALAFAGGDQVQYGRPDGGMPFVGGDDRTDGDWGNPDNNG